MKQTAVEWLFDNLDLSGGSEAIKTLNKAKAMEREQIIKAASWTSEDGLSVLSELAEEYYNETFKQQENEL